MLVVAMNSVCCVCVCVCVPASKKKYHVDIKILLVIPRCLPNTTIYVYDLLLSFPIKSI